MMDRNGQKLETVTSFKYLGLVITDECSKPEILSRTAQTTAALTRLKPVGMTGQEDKADRGRGGKTTSGLSLIHI